MAATAVPVVRADNDRQSSLSSDLLALNELSADTEPLRVLTQVLIVCRARPEIESLQHVAAIIDAFVYCPQHWRYSLEDAVALGNVHLLRRLLSDATTHQRADCGGATTATAALLQHPFYVGLQITRAAQVAVRERPPSAALLLACLWRADPQAVGSDEVIAEAAAVGDLALVKWLHSASGVSANINTAITGDSSAAAARAAESGHVDVLAWLVANRWSSRSRLSIGGAILHEHHDVLAWLDDRHTYTSAAPDVRSFVTCDAIREAAGRGDVEMLQCLFAYPRDASVTYAGNAAAEHGHVHVLDWLHAFHTSEAQCFADGYAGAARNGHIDVLEWLNAHYPRRFWTESMEAAAGAGRIDVVMYLDRQRGAEDDDSVGNCAEFAAAGGHLEVVQLLFELHPNEHHEMGVMRAAAGSGNLALMQWLHETHHSVFTYASVLGHAAQHGRVNVLEYALPFLKNKDITYALETAAIGNRLESMQWIHAQLVDLVARGAVQVECGMNRWRITRTGTPVPPMHFAARNGNLAILQWLTTNGYDDCTALAMDYAAGSGHVDVVRWLHANRSEGCTTKAVDSAVQNGHARVAAFLLAHRSEGCTPNAAQYAVEERRDAELIHLLYAHRRDLVDVARVRAIATADNNALLLRWLRDVVERES